MGHSRTFLRKALKVLRSPRLAAALINAQVRIRGKARLPLSVRLTGRIRLRGDGELEFGQGVTLVGDVAIQRRLKIIRHDFPPANWANRTPPHWAQSSR